MKKKLFSLFLALVASVGIIYASDTQVDGIWYNFNESNNTATVTYRGSSYDSYSNEYSGKVVIPPSVTYNGITYSVTSIGRSAFRDCSFLTSVTIPNSVTSIGVQAFDGCSSLPVTDNIRYAGTYLVRVVDKTQSSYTIQEGTKWIGHDAFSGCSTMTSVTIPNSVTSIGGSAFSDCSSLTSVRITDIEAWCKISFGNYNANPLYYAHNLYLNGELVKDLVIPNGVTSIGRCAFYNCSSLTSVTIPNSVKSIGSSAFNGCYSLTSVTIPNSVTSIGDYAFYGCSSLPSITIPNSVTSIGDFAFIGCDSLTSINVDSNNPNYSSVDGVLFNKYKTTLVAYPGGKQGAYTIPNSVTSIGYAAFSDCSSLTSVTIGNSVTSIVDYAFSGCDKLVDVYCCATTPPEINENSFSNYNAFLYVPCESKKVYMVDAVWGKFKYIECLSSEGIENVQGDEVQSTKVIKDGQVFILRNGKTYTMQGQEVK